ncbi:hypothetical protein DYB25_014184 [Aphanomyces astaci]|uniref:DDE-1 domain-containing protein n=1 Tax=Aphanomyces astaci TaxID=112090 RepID=A0A397FEA0_APHAT|nr:hypothetical protein AaE_009350 [Aphanomyces astaci]RHY11165.1 hypothetical protein DYB36_009687 [Aphanomyces astaci]RHY32073.1 hypothetical protein DYB25_014184 [Aphanomyces astaci]RHY53691.1 hypothetical protein DYB30_009858 [Aphanomyces astaci]RHY74102.1 hypothetical protein DYB38_013234 [Aphanomyces astaci]
MRMRQKYTIADRRKLLAGFDPALSSSKGYAKANGIDWGTWRSWLKKKDVIMTKRINVKKTTLGGQGRRESIPFASEMVAFMESVRGGEHHLTHSHLITFMKNHHWDWYEEYINNKKNDDTAYRSLLRLCQRFSTRYRYSQQVPVPTKVPQAVLAETKATFAAAFWEKFRDTAAEDIINVDETAVYYDMPPTKTLAKIGGSSKVDKDQKHSDRMTAVLSIRSNGEKLPILFIVKGQPGGTIEQNEIPTYPDGHVYVVQKKAWMDTRVWEIYLSDLLKFEINGPSVIVADNLDAHVSKDSYNRVSSELFSVLEPLPKNSTSVCQPLDVGVMGPLKSKLRSKWLHERPVVTAAQKRLAMIQRTIQVWDDIPCSVISGSFTKALPKPDL